jgi:hypothetical protein
MEAIRIAAVPFISITAAVKKGYQQLKHGDVLVNWSKVLRVNHLLHETENRWINCLVNLLMSVWFITNAIRLGFRVLEVNSPYDHIFGQSFNVIPSARMVKVVGTFGLVQVASYRLLQSHLLWKGNDVLMRMVTAGTRERNPVIREKKLSIARNVLMFLVISSSLVCMDGVVIYAGLAVLNIVFAGSVVEVICWIGWGLIEVAMGFTSCADLCLFPLIWIMTASLHRVDFDDVRDQTELLLQRKRLRPGAFDRLVCCFIRLMHQSEAVDRSSAPILFIVSMCITPMLCSAVFVIQFSVSLFLMMTVAAAVFTFAAVAFILMRVASNFATRTLDLHQLLCSLQARESRHRRLTLSQKKSLLIMIEETGSESTSLAYQTITGVRQTSEMLFYYLIEGALMYTLFVTLERSLQMH